MQVSIKVPDWADKIHSDFSDWDRHPQDITSLGNPWVFELADDAYFEYVFLDADGKEQEDIENSHLSIAAENPWFPKARAILGPEFQRNAYSHLIKLELIGFERKVGCLISVLLL